MTRISLGLAVIALLACQSASASFCDAYFPFDGTLADATGNGYDGMMISQSGPAKPQFGEGKYGQALHITGGAAMRAFVDLHHEVCPKFTITAWFKLPSVGAEGPQPIFTTGAVGSSPAIVASGSTLRLYGNGNGLTQKDAIRDGNTWFFVAATFDYEARSYKLYWRNRSQDGRLAESPYDAEDAIWIGTRNDDLKRMAKDLYVDDVHIYGRVLELDEIRDASRNAMAHTASPATNTPAQPVQPGLLQGPVDTNTAGTNLSVPAEGVPGQFEQPVATAQDYAAANDEPLTLEDMRESAAARNPFAESSDALAERVTENRPPDLRDAGGGADGEPPPTAPASDMEPEPVDVVVTPGANPVLTGVSGHFGENRTGREVNNDFLGWISWGESADRPCFLAIRADEDGLGGAPVLYDQCGSGGVNTGSILEVATGRPTSDAFSLWAIRGLRVCNNNRNNKRLKGIQVFTAQIDAGGRRVDLNESDTEERPNCATWDEPVHCPSGTLATGVVVHANEASGSAEQIVGLQLICHELTASR